MKYYLIMAALISLSSCQQKDVPDREQGLRTENFELRQENDSLKLLIDKLTRTFEGDTIQKLPIEPSVNPYPSFPGKHALTLQWIGWDKPGSVIIQASNAGWYTINGGQTDINGNYLKLEGRIKILNNRELEFDGKIETRVDHINAGKPCIKTGKNLFKATGTRKYWRLQNMINCEGGTVTDYIDIYF